MKVRVIMIAAVSADGFISAGTGVPWDLPEDREHFRRLTLGQWLFLGRRTFEEMLGWFGNHQPLVLTRRRLPEPWSEARVAGVSEAVKRVADAGGKSLWVCGGSVAYSAAMPWADELILTEVKTNLGGGISFPAIDEADWKVVRRERREEHDGLSLEWIWYERKERSGSD